jgi:hypothetical protein
MTILFELYNSKEKISLIAFDAKVKWKKKCSLNLQNSEKLFLKTINLFILIHYSQNERCMEFPEV